MNARYSFARTKETHHAPSFNGQATLGMLALAATSFAAPAKATEAWASGQLERDHPAAKSVVVKQGAHEMTFALNVGRASGAGEEDAARQRPDQ